MTLPWYLEGLNLWCTLVGNNKMQFIFYELKQAKRNTGTVL